MILTQPGEIGRAAAREHAVQHIAERAQFRRRLLIDGRPSPGCPAHKLRNCPLCPIAACLLLDNPAFAIARLPRYY